MRRGAEEASQGARDVVEPNHTIAEYGKGAVGVRAISEDFGKNKVRPRSLVFSECLE